MNFKEWLNENDENKPKPEAKSSEKTPEKADNPFVAKLKSQKTSSNLPNFKEDKWRLHAMKWKYHGL